MTNRQLIAKLKQAHTRIARERDKLRELQETVEQLEYSCQQAIDDIDHAVEALSELQ